MRTYEALFIIQPEAAEDDVQTIAKGVETLITDAGGAIVRSEIWGKRRLAYEVAGHKEGIYVLLRFDAPVTLVKMLEEQFKLNESVIRDLVILLDAKTLRLEAEQLRRNEEARENRSREDDDDGDSRPPRRSAPEKVETAVEA